MSRDNLRPERLINAPPHSANVWMMYEPGQGPLQRWRFGAGAQYVGDRRVNIAGDFSAPAYSRIDAMTSYRLDAHWHLQLNMKNIGNRRYYETDGHFGLLLPASPRTAEVTARFAF
jgi:outer membrane receptor protein involved in Fe transport